MGELNPHNLPRSGANPDEDFMAEYLLVSFKTCPWVQRSAISLREKSTPFCPPSALIGQNGRIE